MKTSTNLEAVPEGVQVILFATVRRAVTCCLARPHWFVETEADKSTTRRLGWQSTWDGTEIPREWVPYAWSEIVAPDPAAEDVV